MVGKLFSGRQLLSPTAGHPATAVKSPKAISEDGVLLLDAAFSSTSRPTSGAGARETRPTGGPRVTGIALAGAGVGLEPVDVALTPRQQGLESAGTSKAPGTSAGVARRVSSASVPSSSRSAVVVPRLVLPEAVVVVPGGRPMPPSGLPPPEAILHGAPPPPPKAPPGAASAAPTLDQPETTIQAPGAFAPGDALAADTGIPSPLAGGVGGGGSGSGSGSDESGGDGGGACAGAGVGLTGDVVIHIPPAVAAALAPDSGGVMDDAQGARKAGGASVGVAGQLPVGHAVGAADGGSPSKRPVRKPVVRSAAVSPAALKGARLYAAKLREARDDEM
jgi:hypothetical protein